MFFSASNPGMYMGGFVDYSKYDILKKIPQNVVPKTILIEENDHQLKSVKSHLDQKEIDFPFILKPSVPYLQKIHKKEHNHDKLNFHIEL
jgi:hypothetical protein